MQLTLEGNCLSAWYSYYCYDKVCRYKDFIFFSQLNLNSDHEQSTADICIKIIRCSIIWWFYILVYLHQFKLVTWSKYCQRWSRREGNRCARRRISHSKLWRTEGWHSNTKPCQQLSHNSLQDSFNGEIIVSSSKNLQWRQS